MCHRGADCRLRRLYVAKPNAVCMAVARIRNTDLPRRPRFTGSLLHSINRGTP
jgi:hypothetical protein